MDKGKVTAKINLSNVITLHSTPPSRPLSPAKPKPPPPPSMFADPTFRPKAKISSSAAIVVARSSSSSSTGISTVKSTTRPPSPLKGHARKLSSTRSAVDVHVSRPKASLAPHELSRQRSLTSSLEASSSAAARGSFGSLHPTPPTAPSSRLSPDNPSPSPAVRVKAKVSSVAKSNTSPTPTNSLHPSSPPLATICPTESRPRALPTTNPSSFSSGPPSPSVSPIPLSVHPITTPTSAANPHRYASRTAPHTVSARFQSLSPPSSCDPDNGVTSRVSSTIDPASIPLPPQSPPTSTLSFSSQSSRNTQDTSDSASTAPTPYSRVHSTTLITGERGGPALGSGPTFDVFDDLCDSNSPLHSPGSIVAYSDRLEDSDRKTRAEAKTNRKIEDLKITNRSLLAINATLEATKYRQATEIRELRRKLRESRLMLPPRAFRAIKSSLNPEDMADDEDIDDDNDEGGDENDETYRRIKGILEDLLETGRRALRAESRDFGKQGSGMKVLSAEEVRSWRGDSDLSSIHSLPTEADTDEESHPQQNRLTPSQAAVSEDRETARSNDDGEGVIVMSGDEHNARSLPPITVTFL